MSSLNSFGGSNEVLPKFAPSVPPNKKKGGYKKKRKPKPPISPGSEPRYERQLANQKRKKELDELKKKNKLHVKKIKAAEKDCKKKKK